MWFTANWCCAGVRWRREVHDAGMKWDSLIWIPAFAGMTVVIWFFAIFVVKGILIAENAEHAEARRGKYILRCGLLRTGVARA